MAGSEANTAAVADRLNGLVQSCMEPIPSCNDFKQTISRRFTAELNLPDSPTCAPLRRNSMPCPQVTSSHSPNSDSRAGVLHGEGLGHGEFEMDSNSLIRATAAGLLDLPMEEPASHLLQTCSSEGDSVVQNIPKDGPSISRISNASVLSCPLICQDEVHVGAVLGKGAFAEVFKGHMQLNSKLSGVPAKGKGKDSVALKKLTTKNPISMFAFFQEAETLSKLDHIGIVKTHGIGCERKICSTSGQPEDTPYLVQDLASDGTLKSLLFEQMGKKKGLYSWSEGARWISELAAALHYIHNLPGQKIIHRDIKPDNILLDRDVHGRLHAKLADFGLCRIVLPANGCGLDRVEDEACEPKSKPKSKPPAARGGCSPRPPLPPSARMLNIPDNKESLDTKPPSPIEQGEQPALPISYGGNLVSSAPEPDATSPSEPRHDGASWVHGIEYPSAENNLCAKTTTPGKSEQRRDGASSTHAMEHSSTESNSCSKTTTPGKTATSRSGKGPVKCLVGLGEKWMLTGDAGSSLYMAPEVAKFEPYNEKVDVYALGLLAYEVFRRYPLLIEAAPMCEQQQVDAFAARLANGWRPDLSKLPGEIADLISSAWAQDPDDRPDAGAMASQFTALSNSPVVHQHDLLANSPSPACGCTIM